MPLYRAIVTLPEYLAVVINNEIQPLLDIYVHFEWLHHQKLGSKLSEKGGGGDQRRFCLLEGILISAQAPCTAALQTR